MNDGHAAYNNINGSIGELHKSSSSSAADRCAVIPGPWGTEPTTKGWHDRSGSCCDFRRAREGGSNDVRTEHQRPLVVQDMALRPLKGLVSQYEQRGLDSKQLALLQRVVLIPGLAGLRDAHRCGSDFVLE